MNKKQIISLKMYHSIEKYIRNTPFECLPKINDIIEDFRLKIATIEAIAIDLEKSDSTIKEKLCRAGADIELLLVKTAKTQGHGYGMELTVDIFYASLLRKNKQQLVDTLQRINIQGCQKMEILSSHGITPCVMEYFKSLIKDYWDGNTVSLVRRINEKKLRALYVETEILLKRIDKEAERYQKENPDFYTAYAANRVRIFPYKMNITKIKGLVINEDLLPVEGAVVSIYGTDYQTKTDNCGYYILQNIPFGTLKVIATACNHEKEAINISIHKSKSNKIDFMLRNESRNSSGQRYAV